MEKVAPNSKFVGHSTEIIQQSKIEGPLLSSRRLDALLNIWTIFVIFDGFILSFFDWFLLRSDNVKKLEIPINAMQLIVN